MKNIYIYLTAMFMLITGVISCGDNMDVSTPHELTQEEKDELARQDSIREELKNRIDADLIFRYDVVIPLPDDQSWGVENVSIDLEAIAELFGITTTQLLEGMYDGKYPDAPDIKGFAIQSTGIENSSSTTTSGPWGHWWDVNGNVVSYGDASVVFAEFNYNLEDHFTVGQFPGKYNGEKVRIVECLKYNDKRVAIVFNVSGLDSGPYVDPETPPTGTPYAVVKDYEVTLPSDAYSGDDIDVKEILRDAFKMTTYQIYQAIKEGELIMKGLNADGSVYLTDEGEVGYTAGYPGHWFNVLGDVCTWGSDGFAYFCELHASEESLVLHPGIGDASSDGDEYHFTQIAELNGGQVTFNVTIKIAD